MMCVWHNALALACEMKVRKSGQHLGDLSPDAYEALAMAQLGAVDHTGGPMGSGLIFHFGVSGLGW